MCDHVSALPAFNRALEKLHEDIEHNTYITFPIDALPAGLPVPNGIKDKCSHLTVVASGDPSDNRDYLLFIPSRVDTNPNGGFVIDEHPILTYFSYDTGTFPGSALIWHHANYDGRTYELPSGCWGESIPETVKNIRQGLTVASGGSCEDEPHIKIVMKETVRVLKGYEKK